MTQKWPLQTRCTRIAASTMKDLIDFIYSVPFSFSFVFAYVQYLFKLIFINFPDSGGAFFVAFFKEELLFSAK